MDVIFNKVLKNKIIKVINQKGGDLKELVLDLPLSIGYYHTIEYDIITNDITLHMFDLDFDYPYNYDDLSKDDRLRVYQILNGIQHLY